MNAAHRLDPEIAALREDLSDLRRDFVRLTSHLTTDATHKGREAADRLEEGADQIYQDAASRSARAAREVGRRIKARPMTAALWAAGIGCIGFLLISR